MKKNLRIKFLIIAGIVLACIYGIIGLPTSKAQLVDNWNRNIHLGLDLRGGTYLVVQVQEQDAFNSEANTQADQIRESARKVNINLGEVEVQEAKTLADASKVAIIVKGVPTTQAGDFRQIVTQQFSNWTMTPLNSTDYKL